MSTPEVKQCQGQCVTITQKAGGWEEFSIQIAGREHPVKLATKQDDIKAKGRAAGGAVTLWSFTEKDGNPNPHRPGQFYKNRYLVDAVVGGVPAPAVVQAAPAAAGAPVVVQAGAAQAPTVHHEESDAERRSSIERQVVLKATAHLIPQALIESKERYFELIDELADWVSAAPPRQAPENIAAQGAPVVTVVTPNTVLEQQAQAAQADFDDDIPF